MILPKTKVTLGICLVVLACSLLATSAPVGAAGDKNAKPTSSLSGQIHQSVRVPRPGTPSLKPLAGHSAAVDQLNSHLDSSIFNQSLPNSNSVPSFSSDAAATAPGSGNAQSAPLLPQAPAAVPGAAVAAHGGVGINAVTPREGAGADGGELNYDYGKKPPRTGKKVLIRIKKFRSGQEMEVVWEAARVANAMSRKGADVTVLLDMEAVHAANKSDTMNAWYEPNRGNGNTAAPRLTTPQDLLEQFVQNGGRLCISERWAKLFGMAGGGSHALSGSEMLSDEAIADLLLETDNCIDY